MFASGRMVNRMWTDSVRIRSPLNEVITSERFVFSGRRLGGGGYFQTITLALPECYFQLSLGVLSTYHPDVMELYLTPESSSYGWRRRRVVLVRSRSYALGRRSGMMLSSMAYDPRNLPFDSSRLSSVICISGHFSLVSWVAGKGGDDQLKLSILPIAGTSSSGLLPGVEQATGFPRRWGRRYNHSAKRICESSLSVISREGKSRTVW